MSRSAGIRGLLVGAWMLALVAPSHPLVAQRVATVDDRAADPSRVLDDLLSRPVTVHVTNVSLRTAIDAAAVSAKVPVQYRTQLVEGYQDPVSLNVTHTPLRVALEQLLAGTRIRVVPDGTTQLMLVDDASLHASQGTGTIVGVVRNAKTNQPVAGASLVLDDSTSRTHSDDAGHYRFSDIPAGAHRVTVRAVGFARQARVVTVREGETATIQFALQSSVNTLDQVVVTVTGEQRVRELGHVVAQINADSLVKAAPISNMFDLLQSRVPGLEVLTGNGGTAGGTASLRLRGQGSINLNSEPIVIVDGVRFKTDNLVPNNANGAFLTQDNREPGETRSLLYDLNPNDIATVDIVKGPSASTLYGPDAANGVIVITTKHGQAGKTEFRWYARPITNSVPTATVAKVYQAFGHDSATGQLFQGNCSLIYQYQYHVCVLDSIAPVPTLAVDPGLSVIAKNRPSWQYGANVSGGTQAIQYFLSGNYDSQLGALVVSPRLTQYLEGILGTSSLSNALRNPNAMQDLGGRANVSIDMGTLGSVAASLGYTQTTHRSTGQQGGLFFGNAPGTDTSDLGNVINPWSMLTASQEQSSRLDASLNGTYRPFTWLTGTAVVGLDLAPSVLHVVLPLVGSTPSYVTSVQDSRRNNVGRTLNLGATALANSGPVTFRSSAGVQYTYTHLDGVDVFGRNLAPGSGTLQGAGSVYSNQLWNEVASLGTYAEEVIGLHNRLFLTGSLRIDGSSTFGDAYHPTPYPKVGVSWIASDEPFLRRVPGLSELRFRYSFGASSSYPTSGMTLGTQRANQFVVDGTQQTVFQRDALGNPSLGPERKRETEYGADATLISRVQLGLTWYTRRTTDQLLMVNNADGLMPEYRNLGLVAAHGFEATMNANLVNTAWVQADLGFTYSFHTDKVLSLGDAPDARGNYGGYAVGYPLAAEFGRPVIGVADTVGNHADSIVFYNEIVRDSVSRFLGVTVPPKTYTLTPTLTFLGSHLRLSTTFDRETGFVVYNYLENNPTFGLCLAAFERTAPVLAQANCLAGTHVKPGDFTRWREMTVTFDIPSRFLRIDLLHLRFSQASFSLQGRDLYLWTKYNGSDPESRANPGGIDPTAAGIPQARAWSFRFDLTP